MSTTAETYGQHAVIDTRAGIAYLGEPAGTVTITRLDPGDSFVDLTVYAGTGKPVTVHLDRRDVVAVVGELAAHMRTL